MSEDVNPVAHADAAPEFELRSGPSLEVMLDGYEGPLDLMLALVRDQKLDLLQLSMLHLAEQYLAFIESAERIRLEIAAEYLVMAAWLTYLKSRLLLPQDEEEEVSAEEEAEAMRLRLIHLQKIRDLGELLWARPQLGREIFAYGLAEGFRIKEREETKANLHGLLTAYAQLQLRRARKKWRRPPEEIVSVEAARRYLRSQLGGLADWTKLRDFWLGEGQIAKRWQMALAGGYMASLESAHDKELEIRQNSLDEALFIKHRPAANRPAANRPAANRPAANRPAASRLAEKKSEKSETDAS